MTSLSRALLLLSSLTLVGCGDDSPDPAGGAGAGGITASESVRVMNTVPPFRLRNQANRQFGSKEVFGRCWVATFIFTRCKATCPKQTAAMIAMQEQLKSHPMGKQVGFVTFTVDPEHDTPEVLAAYAKESGCDLSNWIFLTGEREKLWSLCKDGFNLPVNDDPNTIIAHSPNLILVDRARRVRGYYDAQDEAQCEQLLNDMAFVVNDPPGPIGVVKSVPDDKSTGSVMYQPAELRETAWMKARAEAQMATKSQFGVYSDFQFTDVQPGSGITFMNECVDDAGRNYKGVHYDHGNGVAIADVDGDGRQDIYFTNQIGANQLARNLGGGKFEDITDAAGVGVADRISVAASFADTDNDGDADLFVTTVRGGNLLFENDGKGKFTDISEASGLNYVGHSSAAVFFDYDRDGLLDLFLTNPGKYTTDEVGRGGAYVGYQDGFYGHLSEDRTERSVLYRNEGGNKFVDVSEKTGLMEECWTGAATPIDLNEDGWQDLYVLSMQGHDEYWENQGGQRFVRKSREVFPRTSWGSMGVKVFDFDNDGRMDIYVTDMHTDMVDELPPALRREWFAEKMKMTERFPADFLATDGQHVLGNALYHNQGNGKFKERSDELNAENYWPWGLSVADLNADGWQDAFVASSMNYPFRYGVNSVLLNNNGEKFMDAEFIVGVEPRRDGRLSKVWFELDMDGADKDHDMGKGRSGNVQVHGALGTRSSVVFDLDDDGDLDIVTNDFNSEPMVLVSNLAEKNGDLHFLKVKLVGTSSNKDGLGAIVKVTCGDRTYTKVHDGQSGYMSQSSAPLYFGLGSAVKADEVEVTWLGGKTQSMDGVDANQLLTVTESE